MREILERFLETALEILETNEIVEISG